jgi:type VI secretion system secreted protein Hcp
MKPRQFARTRKSVQVVLAAGVALGAVPAVADSIFLKIPGLPGESMDSKHKDEIIVESFSQSVDAGQCPQVNIAKRVDKATPGLVEAAAAVRPVPFQSATLSVTRNGEYKEGDDYLTLAMSGAVVTSNSLSIDGGEYGDGGGWEQFTLSPQSVVMTYRPVDAQTGKFFSPITKTIVCGKGSKLGGR